MSLKANLEWARSCNTLVNSGGWDGFKQKVIGEAKDTGNRLVSMMVRPEQMHVVAERSKSRTDLLSEVEMEAKRFESLEAKFQEFSKAINRH